MKAPKPDHKATATSTCKIEQKTFISPSNPSGPIQELTLESPWGPWIIWARDEAIIGLWPEGGQPKDKDKVAVPILRPKRGSALDKGRRWFIKYINGKISDPRELPLSPLDATDFRLKVWDALLDILYGQSRSYADIADVISGESSKASPRAIGGAVGANPISLIIPCHRVLAKDGSLGGYAWGLELKERLLQHEAQSMEENHTR